MTSFELLKVIGCSQDEFICAAADTRRNRTGNPLRLHRRMLIAAILVLILLLTACAAVFSKDLLAAYFLKLGQTMGDSQFAYIQENTQNSVATLISAHSENGCKLNVRSALTDGAIAYITLDIIAPEETSLDGSMIYFTENPRLIPTPADGLILEPDGSAMTAMCDYETIDDYDGLSNTASLLFQVNLFTDNAALTPFDGSIQWRLEVGDFGKSVFMSPRIPLDSGKWVFDLHFEQINTRELEFVMDPVEIKTSDWIQNEYVHENKVLSLALGGLTYRLALEQPTVNGETQDIGNVIIVMKDGSMQTLLCLTPQVSSLIVPVDLDSVDYVLLTARSYTPNTPITPEEILQSGGIKLDRKNAVPADSSNITYKAFPNPSPERSSTVPVPDDPFKGYTHIPQSVPEDPANYTLEVMLPEGGRFEAAGDNGGLFYRGDTIIGGFQLLHFEKGILPTPFEHEAIIVARVKEAFADQIDLSDFQGKVTTEGSITVLFTKGDQQITYFMSPLTMTDDMLNHFGLWADTSHLTPEEAQTMLNAYLNRSSNEIPLT